MGLSPAVCVLLVSLALSGDACHHLSLGEERTLSCTQTPASLCVVRDERWFARAHALWSVHSLELISGPPGSRLEQCSTSAFQALSLARPTKKSVVFGSPAEDLFVRCLCGNSTAAGSSGMSLTLRAKKQSLASERVCALVVGLLLLTIGCSPVCQPARNAVAQLLMAFFAVGLLFLCSSALLIRLLKLPHKRLNATQRE